MRNMKGFTLIEVIVTIVIAAIVGTVILSYLGTSLTQSGTPLARLQQATGLHTAMEIINADYKKNYRATLWTSAKQYNVNDIVVPTTVDKVGSNPNYIRYFYKCTIAGISGSTEPAWTTTVGATYSDGTTGLVWTQAYILDGLQTAIGGVGGEGSTITSYAGVSVSYTVVRNRYVEPNPTTPTTFLDSNSTTGRKDLLKVTIKNAQGETLTTLFTGQ